MSPANADRLFGLVVFGGMMLAALVAASASQRHQLAGRLADQLDRLAAACRRYRRRRYPLLDPEPPARHTAHQTPRACPDGRRRQAAGR